MPEGRAGDPQHRFWSEAFGGPGYYYGDEPGPVARRAVRYHRLLMPQGGTAFDAGSGEGQDLAFLAERGYRATGIEFTATGIRKSEQLLRSRSLEAELLECDLRDLAAEKAPQGRQFDLVLAVNTLQFMGEAGSPCLDRLAAAVRPGGVIGLSLFAREADQPALDRGIWYVSLDELIGRFPRWQMLEAACLWQWHVPTNWPQPFVTLIARAPGPGSAAHSLPVWGPGGRR
jgi:SAM-dependent methyltransferase